MDESGSGLQERDVQNQFSKRGPKNALKFRPINDENPEVELVFIDTTKEDYKKKDSLSHTNSSISCSVILFGTVPRISGQSAEIPKDIPRPNTKRQENKKKKVKTNTVAEADDLVVKCVPQGPNTKQQETNKERANENVAEDDDSAVKRSEPLCIELSKLQLRNKEDDDTTFNVIKKDGKKAKKTTPNTKGTHLPEGKWRPAIAAQMKNCMGANGRGNAEIKTGSNTRKAKLTQTDGEQPGDVTAETNREIKAKKKLKKHMKMRTKRNV